ncbi:hypothetical protein JCM10213_008818 [Rhodosporidiobolus nylandii]
MQERRAPPSSLRSSRRSEGQLPRTTRLSKASLNEAQSPVGFLPSSTLPYLSRNPSRTTPRSSSLPTTALRHPSNAAALHARRNFSVSALPSTSSAHLAAEEPRPKSFPPLKQRRAPPKEVSVTAGHDPFKLHANRILRPAASFSHLPPSTTDPAAPALEANPSSSSTSSGESSAPSLRRQSAQKRPQSSLRRTATVRSAHRHSRTGSIVRGGTRKRLFAAISASAPSPSSAYSSEMGRDLSAGTASVYSQDSFAPARRAGGVLVDEEGGQGDDLLRQWAAFVGSDSPLMQQMPPPASPAPMLRPRASEPSFPPVRNVHMDPPPSPTRSTADSAYSSCSPRSSRDLSTSLPRTTTFLDARQRESYYLPSSPSLQLHAAEISTSMTRVDSEVLLTRMALKRLASTGFEGDALDKLGREPLEDEDEGGDAERDKQQPEAWEDEEEFSDRYRDSYAWQRSSSGVSLESSASSQSRGSSGSSGSSRFSHSSRSSSSSSSMSLSRSNSGVKAWKWRPGGGDGGGISASSSATSIGSLQRWSKSTLMDELEREFADLSYELQREPSAQSSVMLGPIDEAEAEWEDDGEEYVCALDILLESDEEDEPGPPPPPPPAAIIVPLAPVSRLPRLMPSYSSLRNPAPAPASTRADPAPPVPSLLPRLVKRASPSSPGTATSPAPAPTRPLRSEPAAYNDLISPSPSIDWLLLGVKGTGNRLALLDTGDTGLKGLRASLRPRDVQFGLVRVEGRLVLFSLIPDAVGGVKRARALVQARTVASAFRAHRGVLNARSPADFEVSAIQARLQNSPSLQTTPPTRYPPTSSQPHSPPILYSTDQFSSSPREAHNHMPQKPPSPLPNGFVTATSNLSIRSNSPQQHPTPSANNFPSSASPSSRPRGQPSPPPIASTSHHPPQQRFSSGFPVLGPPAHTASLYDPSHSPTNGAAPAAFAPRRASLTPSQHAPETALSVPSTVSLAPSSLSPLPPNPADEWRRQTHYRPSSPPSSSFAATGNPDAEDGNDFFSAAAAAMLAPITPDPNTLDPEADADGDLAPPRPAFAGAHSSVSLGPSVQSVPVDVVPGEDGNEDRGATEAAAAAAREQREEAARMERERREREAEERARERARREIEEQERREVEIRRRLEEEARIAAEEALAAAEEAELERAARDAHAREEAERLAVEEAERTRQAEEEMRLLIERQRAEKRLREEEERRRLEEEKQREKEVRRREMVRRRDDGEVMMKGAVNVQGGNSMLWKRRHFQLAPSGLALFKSELETSHPLETIPVPSIASLTESSIEEALDPTSFKVTLRDDDEYILRADTMAEKEELLVAIRCAARMA